MVLKLKELRKPGLRLYGCVFHALVNSQMLFSSFAFLCNLIYHTSSFTAFADPHAIFDLVRKVTVVQCYFSIRIQTLSVKQINEV